MVPDIRSEGNQSLAKKLDGYHYKSSKLRKDELTASTRTCHFWTSASRCRISRLDLGVRNEKIKISEQMTFLSSLGATNQHKIFQERWPEFHNKASHVTTASLPLTWPRSYKNIFSLNGRAQLAKRTFGRFLTVHKRQ